jgi:hypothetical protein
MIKNKKHLRFPFDSPSYTIGVSKLYKVKVKVKCTLAQALKLCTGRTAHKGSKGIALLFLDHGIRRG